jgi:hypothetical protein
MPYKGITKSRKNKSGRKSEAKREAEKSKMRMATGKVKVQSKKKGGERLAQGVPYKLKRMEAMPVRQLPETAATKRGMSLRELIRCTPKLFLYNATEVRARTIELKKTQTARPVIYGQMVTDDPWRRDRTRRIHETYIIGMDDDDKKPITRHKKVLIQCSCENFVYVFEYANASVGASRLIYCNGDYPYMTNPSLAPGCCKHVIALAKIAIEKNL